MSSEDNDDALLTNDRSASVLHDTLARYFHEVDGVMLVRFTMQAEIISQGGHEHLVMAASPDSARWSKLGLVDYAATVLREEIAMDARDDDARGGG